METVVYSYVKCKGHMRKLNFNVQVKFYMCKMYRTTLHPEEVIKILSCHQDNRMPKKFITYNPVKIPND